MKKAILICASIGLISLSSCKKEEIPNDSTVENTQSEMDHNSGELNEPNDPQITESEIPKFSDPDVQAYANELAKYYNEFRVAEEKGDQARLEELLKQQVSYHQKQQEVLQSQPTEEKEKFRAWAAEVAKAAQE